MTRPPRTMLISILTSIWVLVVFVLYMAQFKPIILSIAGWVLS